MAIDVLRLAPSAASSRARSAMPRYTLAMSGSAHIDIAHDVGIGAVAGGDDAPDAVVGHEDDVEHGVVALRRAHAERVPRLDDGDAGAGALDEGMHRLRPARSGGVDGVGAQPGPGRTVGAELLAAGQAVAALDPLGDARRQQHRDVVAGLGVAGGDDLAVERRPRGSSAATSRRRARARRRRRPSRCAWSSTAPSPGRSGRGDAGWRPSRTRSRPQPPRCSGTAAAR